MSSDHSSISSETVRNSEALRRIEVFAEERWLALSRGWLTSCWSIPTDLKLAHLRLKSAACQNENETAASSAGSCRCLAQPPKAVSWYASS